MKVSPYSLAIGAIFGLSAAYAYYAHDVVTSPEPEPEAVYYGSNKVCYSIDSHTRVDKIPGLINSWQLTTECRIDPEETYTVISMFYKAWTDEFGPDEGLRIFKAFNSLIVEWAEEPFEISQEVWEHHFGKTPVGVVYGEATWKETPNVWIVRSMTGSLYDEPKRFIHELVHIALRASDPASRGDFDHEGSKIVAWTKRHTKLINTVGNYIIPLNQEDDI